jgi:hypothetical protein
VLLRLASVIVRPDSEQQPTPQPKGIAAPATGRRKINRSSKFETRTGFVFPCGQLLGACEKRSTRTGVWVVETKGRNRGCLRKQFSRQLPELGKLETDRGYKWRKQEEMLDVDRPMLAAWHRGGGMGRGCGGVGGGVDWGRGCRGVIPRANHGTRSWSCLERREVVIGRRVSVHIGGKRCYGLYVNRALWVLYVKEEAKSGASLACRTISELDAEAGVRELERD